MIINYKNNKISYIRVKYSDGSPMIFIHNGGSSNTIWRYLFEHFKNTYDVIAIDLPGYGLSEPLGGFTFEEYVDFLEYFIKELKLNDITLIGNCMGSAISLLYAHREQERERSIKRKIKSLILFNPLTLKTYENGGLNYFSKIDKFSPKILDNILSLTQKVNTPSFVISNSIDMQLGTPNNKIRNDRNLHKYYPGNLIALRNLLKEIPKLDVLENISLLVPTYIIWGSKNKVLSAEAGRIIKSTKTIYLENCGHLPMLENPSEVIKIIENILGIHKRSFL